MTGILMREAKTIQIEIVIYITFYFLSFLGWEFSIQFFVEVGDVYRKTDSHFLVKHLLGNHSY